jgi:hypothetical protein
MTGTFRDAPEKYARSGIATESGTPMVAGALITKSDGIIKNPYDLIGIIIIGR